MLCAVWRSYKVAPNSSQCCYSFSGLSGSMTPTLYNVNWIQLRAWEILLLILVWLFLMYLPLLDFRFYWDAALWNDLQNVTGVMISTHLIRNRLFWADMKVRRQAKHITVTWKDIQARLQGAHVHTRITLNNQCCSLTNQYFVWTSLTDESVYGDRLLSLSYPCALLTMTVCRGLSHDVGEY